MLKIKVICLCLICGVAFGALAGCGKPKDTPSDTSSTPAPDDTSSWMDDLPVVEGGEPSGQFDNTSSSGGGTASKAGTASTKPDPEPDPVNKRDPLEEFGQSAIADKSQLSYCHDGDNYRYGITKDKTEVMAYTDANGFLIDMLAGGGEFILKSTTGSTVVTAGSMTDFNSIIRNNRPAVTVTYAAIGENSEAATIKTTYIFYGKNIVVECSVDYANSTYTLSATNSQLSRRFLNGVQSCDKRLSEKWMYPTDGDWPYKEFDGIATINTVGSAYEVYTLLLENGASSFTLETYPEAALPLSFAEDKGLMYTMKYAVTFAEKSTKNNTDYLSLFNAHSAEFATRITPVKPNADNSTLFEGQSVSFNINVTNLTRADLTFSLRYEVRDYDGNIIESNIFLNSKVFNRLDANRVIHVNPKKYGLFYINLAAVSKNSSYRETYSFALLEPHNFGNNAASPFGISAIPVGPRYNIDNEISIAKKMGIANTRFGIEPVIFQENKADSLAAAKKLKAANIILNGMVLYWTEPTNAAAYQQIIEGALPQFQPYLDSLEIGNENNMPVLNAGANLNDTFKKFKDNVFTPGYNVLSKINNLPYLIGANAGNDYAWDKAVYDNGLWDKFDILSTHPYGYPYAPDTAKVGDPLWHTEAALERTKRVLNEFGPKRVYVTEIGWPTVPGSKRECDIRTQGDYMIRSYLMCLSYGIEKVQWYCFYDMFSFASGFNQTDVEYHFGSLYFPNYYGTVQPKPSSIAFSTMTRALDTVKKVDRSADPSATSRAYKATLANNSTVTVAWSNCSPVANDTTSTVMRDPTSLWKNQWKQSENVKFATANNSVTVTDSMGNAKTYTAAGGFVTVPLNGSPVFIKGL